MTTKKFHLTTHGRARFESELVALENYVRTVARRLRRSFRRENNSENGDLEIAQSEIDFAEARIGEITYILQNAETITKPRRIKEIALGSKVRVRCVGGGCDQRKAVYELVGSLESDPETGKISNLSPLGQAMMGRRVGETVSVTTPKGEANYRILKIN